MTAETKGAVLRHQRTGPRNLLMFMKENGMWVEQRGAAEGREAGAVGEGGGGGESREGKRGKGGKEGKTRGGEACDRCV